MVVNGGENYPFFSKFDGELKKIFASEDRGISELIARDAVFYKKTLFRAFLHLTKEECDDMTFQRYIDYSVALESVLRLIHAPYMKQDD